ncbi:MAG TPA: VWA domain-containing protein [Bryobacteraceae bacterium]|nr:VWA domain-containing protein [Bryobacteraceae bacterium]
MSFLNLSLGELIGIAGAISAGVVALYLFDRSKRKQTVATLRFWSASDVRTELKHRKRIQQPWSLLLQLLSIICLLLAVAGPRFGGDEDNARDHVVILDTSAWMGTRVRQGTLLDEAKASARAFVKALPSRDRVMIVRADALATPATAFESNRQTLEDAIRTSQPTASALNLDQAFEFATRAQKLQPQRAGDIVFAGAGRVQEGDVSTPVPPNLRVLAVNSNQENVGLRKIGLRRSQTSADTWDIFVAVKNYGTRPRNIDLALQFGGAPAGSKALTLKPGAEEQATFSHRTKVAGYLEARITPHDAFPQDDRAVIELPAQKALRVVVYSADPQGLRALFASNAQVDAVFEAPAKYDPQVKADIVVLDRFAPAARPHVDSIWIEPPVAGSPIPVKTTKSGVKLERWRPDSTLGAGLRTKDVQLESGEIFAAAAGDIPVAEASDGPLILARPGAPKILVMGFEPWRSSLKYELATPLLIANILRWMAPETFRRLEVQAGTVGTVNVGLEKNTDPAAVRVLTEDRRPLPFTIEGNSLRFFAGAPGTVRVLTGDREAVYSLTLPDVGDTAWKPPANVRKGIPRPSEAGTSVTDLWPWLAALGGIGLLADWLLFGRSRAFRLRAVRVAARAVLGGSVWRKAS